MIYYSSKELFDFRIFKTIRSFGDDIYSNKITINEADQEQSDLVEYILNFNNKTRPKKKMVYTDIYINLVSSMKTKKRGLQTLSGVKIHIDWIEL